MPTRTPEQRERRRLLEKKNQHCLECGSSDFGHKRQRYCSAICASVASKRWWGSHLAGGQRNLGKSCVRCGEALPKKHQKYCSVRCRKRAVVLERYDLPPNWDLAEMERTEGTCLACQRPMTIEESAVDHCHETGVVRGLIHSVCNVRLEDDEEKAFLYQVYLTRSRFDLRSFCGS